MTEEERAQLIAMGLDPHKLDPQSPLYDPNYGDDVNPSKYWPDGTLKGGTDNNGKPEETKYLPQYAQVARVMCRGGATAQELAEAFGVSYKTIYNWRDRFEEFREAMQEGREALLDRVEDTLHMRALGYSIDVEKLFCHEGQVTRAWTKEYLKPDVKAINTVLYNRRGDRWKQRAEVKHVQGGFDPLDNMSVQERARYLAFIEKRNEEIQKEQQKIITIEAIPVPPEKESV